MDNTLTLLGVGVAAGLIVGSPLVYAFWRARKTAMLATVPTVGWNRPFIIITVVVVTSTVIVAAVILPGDKLAGFLGGTLVASATAVGVWRGVTGLARAQESRHD